MVLNPLYSNVVIHVRCPVLIDAIITHVAVDLWRCASKVQLQRLDSAASINPPLIFVSR